MKPIFETCQPRSFDNTWRGREGAPRGRPVNNSTEVAYSLAFAQLLRHGGLNAQGEQRHTCGQARRQADALLDFDDYAGVTKGEFGAPAKTDADKRFPPDQRAMVGGLPLRIAVAEGYAERLADRPESDTNSNLAATTDLTISHRYHGDEPGESVGTVARLLARRRAAPTVAPTLPRNASLNVVGRLDAKPTVAYTFWADEAEVEETGDRERTETIISNVTATSGRTVQV